MAVSLAVRQYIAKETEIKAIRFITNYLILPPKRAVLAHLGIPLTPGGKIEEKDKVPIVRKAEVDVSLFFHYDGDITCHTRACIWRIVPVITGFVLCFTLASTRLFCFESV